MGHGSGGSWVNCVTDHMGHGSRKMTHFHLWLLNLTTTEAKIKYKDHNTVKVPRTSQGQGLKTKQYSSELVTLVEDR